MTPKHSLARAAALAFALALAPAAWAHDDATLDTIKAPNGGQLRAAGEYHFELVVAPAGAEAKLATVRVFVTDHAGNKLATTGAAGTATLLTGGQKTSIALQADGDNRLAGSGVYRSAADMKAIVSITLADKPAEQARFTPLAKDAHAGHH